MRNIILSVIAAMSAMLAVSCQKGDGEADYGNSLIYIPQATVSAGIDNYYNVPSGGAENTLNFGTTETDVDIHGAKISAEGEYQLDNVVETLKFPSLWAPIPYTDIRRCSNLVQNEGWETWR